MAEAIGLAASILQIAGAGTKLSVTLYNFVGSAARADHEISEIAGDVEITANALDSVGRVFEDDDLESVVSKKAIQDAKNLIKRCEMVFGDIEELTEKRRKVGKDGKKVLNTLGRLSFPLKEQRIQLLRSRLESLKNSLILLLHVLQLANGQAKGKLERSALEEEREKIRELHQRQQSSIKSLEALESRLCNVRLDDEETLQGSNASLRTPTINSLKRPRSPNSEGNDVTSMLAMTHHADTDSSASEDSEATDDEQLTIEELAKCANHVTKLLKRISALQQSFESTQSSSHLPRTRVRKMYRRFCRKFESEIVLQAQSKLPDPTPLPSFDTPAQSVPPVQSTQGVLRELNLVKEGGPNLPDPVSSHAAKGPEAEIPNSTTEEHVADHDDQASARKELTKTKIKPSFWGSFNPWRPVQDRAHPESLGGDKEDIFDMTFGDHTAPSPLDDFDFDDFLNDGRPEIGPTHARTRTRARLEGPMPPPDPVSLPLSPNPFRAASSVPHPIQFSAPRPQSKMFEPLLGSRNPFANTAWRAETDYTSTEDQGKATFGSYIRPVVESRSTYRRPQDSDNVFQNNGTMATTSEFGEEKDGRHTNTDQAKVTAHVESKKDEPPVPMPIPGTPVPQYSRHGSAKSDRAEDRSNPTREPEEVESQPDFFGSTPEAGNWNEFYSSKEQGQTAPAAGRNTDASPVTSAHFFPPTPTLSTPITPMHKNPFASTSQPRRGVPPRKSAALASQAQPPSGNQGPPVGSRGHEPEYLNKKRARPYDSYSNIIQQQNPAGQHVVNNPKLPENPQERMRPELHGAQQTSNATLPPHHYSESQLTMGPVQPRQEVADQRTTTAGQCDLMYQRQLPAVAAQQAAQVQAQPQTQAQRAAQLQAQAQAQAQIRAQAQVPAISRPGYTHIVNNHIPGAVGSPVTPEEIQSMRTELRHWLTPAQIDSVSVQQLELLVQRRRMGRMPLPYNQGQLQTPFGSTSSVSPPSGTSQGMGGVSASGPPAFNQPPEQVMMDRQGASVPCNPQQNHLSNPQMAAAPQTRPRLSTSIPESPVVEPTANQTALQQFLHLKQQQHQRQQQQQQQQQHQSQSATSNKNTALADYQAQLNLLESQNRIRKMAAREGQDWQCAAEPGEVHFQPVSKSADLKRTLLREMGAKPDTAPISESQEATLDRASYLLGRPEPAATNKSANARRKNWGGERKKQREIPLSARPPREEDHQHDRAQRKEDLDSRKECSDGESTEEGGRQPRMKRRRVAHTEPEWSLDEEDLDLVGAMDPQEYVQNEEKKSSPSTFKDDDATNADEKLGDAEEKSTFPFARRKRRSFNCMMVRSTGPRRKAPPCPECKRAMRKCTHNDDYIGETRHQVAPGNELEEDISSMEEEENEEGDEAAARASKRPRVESPLARDGAVSDAVSFSRPDLTVVFDTPDLASRFGYPVQMAATPGASSHGTDVAVDGLRPADRSRSRSPLHGLDQADGDERDIVDVLLAEWTTIESL